MKGRLQVVLTLSSRIFEKDAPFSDTLLSSIGKLSYYTDLIRISHFCPICPKSLIKNIKMYDIYNIMVPRLG